MTQKKLTYALGVALVAVVAGLFWYGYFKMGEAPGTNATSTVSSTNDGITVTATGSTTIAEIDTAPTAPNYRKPLQFSASISAEVRDALVKQFDATVAIIAQKPTDFQAWINLGTVRKSAGDYKGAEEVWVYVSKLYPTSSVPFDNLGSLYLDFIKLGV